MLGRTIRLAAPRTAVSSSHLFARSSQRRAISFARPSQKPRSWKGTFARWGIAAGGVYWYATSDSNLFDEKANEQGRIGHISIDDVADEASLPTLDTVLAARRDRQLATMGPPADSQSTQLAREMESTSSQGSASATTASVTGLDSAPETSAEPASPQALEEEAESQGAFNEETGEINWDCPCLGGMAYGPCGENFREAFSCFVYSKEDPKGVDCIDKFKSMQDCFRQYPDVYGAELTDDDEEAEPSTPLDSETPSPAAASVSAAEATPSTTSSQPAQAKAPYSGASTASDAVPEHNLTAAPAATPTNVGGGATQSS